MPRRPFLARLAELLGRLPGTRRSHAEPIRLVAEPLTPRPESDPPRRRSDSTRGEGGGASPERPVGDGGAGPSHGPLAVRFLLSVDDGGQFLVAAADRVTIGHVRGDADLPFLADVGPQHALLERRTSLSGGSVWWIRPLAGEPVRAGGEALAEGGVALRGGARLELGGNLAFRVRAPDPASETLLLELEGGLECHGARAIVLFGDGAGGRLRIGSQGQRHVAIPNLPHEITLVRRGARLLVSCEAGVRGAVESASETFSLPLPPRERLDLTIGRSRDGRPPFALTLEPAERVGRAGAGGRDRRRL